MANWCDASFQKDSRGALSNSRSVILVPLLGKLIESIMKITISGHLDETGLLEKHLHSVCEDKFYLIKKFFEG